MPDIFSRRAMEKHWCAILWLLPGPMLGAIYNARAYTERVRIPRPQSDRIYEYHLTPFTALLGHLLPWLFWGGVIAFICHAIWQRRDGVAWFWAKVLFLPVYFVGMFFLLFHVD